MIEDHNQGNLDKETQRANSFAEKISQILGIKAKVEGFNLLELNKELQTSAYLINLSKRDPKATEVVLITDWDDTLEKYSLRKANYHHELAQLFSLHAKDLADLDLGVLSKFFLSLNEIARCLPADGTHPESYSPYLELLAESYFLEIAQRDPNQFLKILRLTKPALRNLFKNRVLNLLPKTLLTNEFNEKKQKHYFKETETAILDIDLQQIPAQIAEPIWQLFKEAMLGNNLSAQDVENMTLGDEVYWVVSTFGAANFQIEKVLAGLAELQKNGQRLPDEIIIITQGRKDSFLRHFIEDVAEVSGKEIYYLDDSERQLNSFAEEDGLHLLKAVRRGAKRAKEESKYPTVNLDDTPLMDVLTQ